MRRRSPIAARGFVAALLALLVPSAASAAGGHGVSASLWLALAGILLAAKLGGELAVRLKQPPVLGELLAGMVLGNLSLLGVDAFREAAELPAVVFLAELGVVLLLFEVGLESTLGQMRRVAGASGLVALVGVLCPMLLGYGASAVLVPEGSFALHLFIGATLTATSVGITARVAQDLGAARLREMKIILGAAVIDDVLGLLVLAVVAPIAASGALPPAADLWRIVLMASGFLVGALLVGTLLMPAIFRRAAALRAPGVAGALAIGLCLALSGISAAAGLAAIVGAFAAGLVLDEVHVRPFGLRSAHDLSEYVGPVVAVVAPVFFVRTGMMVQAQGLGTETLLLAGGLTLAAVVGKAVSGLAVVGRGIDRIAVGVGMVPRGEVGLIFAAQGAAIQVGGRPLIAPDVYGALVLCIMATTVLTPPLLAWRFRGVLERQHRPMDEERDERTTTPDGSTDHDAAPADAARSAEAPPVDGDGESPHARP
ncbi:MAG: cation:proton antiporter [Myxococcota bacterium]|nr:cation:proton antiporter [Myxococcota bacterium]MDW8360787.1 cation:proton antiporter [Myxococcales bacterium]